MCCTYTDSRPPLCKTDFYPAIAQAQEHQWQADLCASPHMSAKPLMAGSCLIVHHVIFFVSTCIHVLPCSTNTFIRENSLDSHIARLDGHQSDTHALGYVYWHLESGSESEPEPLLGDCDRENTHHHRDRGSSLKNTLASTRSPMPSMRGGIIFPRFGELPEGTPQPETHMTEVGSPSSTACDSAWLPHGKTQGSTPGWRSYKARCCTNLPRDCFLKRPNHFEPVALHMHCLWL
jgi:hypothetical protein